MPTVEIRPAHINDCRQIWEWENDSVNRALSFSIEQIPWEDHVKWFNSKVNDPKCVILIILFDQKEIGQMRFELDEDYNSVTSIVLGSSFRGQGIGSKAIQQASSHVIERKFCKKIDAYIKSNNIASLKAFGKAGYVLKEEKAKFKGNEAVLMEWR